MRGEKRETTCYTCLFQGSSPLARGKGASRSHLRISEGIIPACAGKSGRMALHHRRAGDHPRLRGEKTHPSFQTQIDRGSSPLARGKDRPLPMMKLAKGIIPACAGKSPHGSCPVRCTQDHPRLRGEKPSGRVPSGGLMGSSPLARGKEAKNLL